jgi:hypothetical protein
VGQLVEVVRGADGDPRLRVVDNLRELAGAQHRHRGHADGANLLHREPRGHEDRPVRHAHEHAVARLDAQRAQGVADPVREHPEAGVREAFAAGEDRDAIPGGVPIQEQIGEIQRVRVHKLRRVPDDGRPQIGWRKMTEGFG